MHLKRSLCYDYFCISSRFSKFRRKSEEEKVIVLFAVIVFLVQAACAVGGTTATQAPPQLRMEAIKLRQVSPSHWLRSRLWWHRLIRQYPLRNCLTITPEVPTFTAVPSVQGSVNYGANCRTGPGANFSNVLVYEQGTQVNVIGTNKATDESTWWLVSSSGQTDCWLIDAAVAITGDKSSVVQVVSPPTPTPVPPPSWSGTWKVWQWQGITVGNNYEVIINVAMI